MDISMQIVQRQCGRYFDSYANCVNSFPSTWHLDCENQKLKLAACAETEPTIMQIKTDCASQFDKYETCMMANPMTGEKCQPLFEEFNKCAVNVAGLQGEQGSSTGTSASAS